MHADQKIKYSGLVLGILILFATAALVRPLLPVDETRYLTVVWEMFLRHGWLDPLTVNFEPYHHKPPFLFWLVNLSWRAFGVSRMAAFVPLIASCLAVIYLTCVLSRRLFPDTQIDSFRTSLIMAGSVPFIIYSTLVLFDLTLTVFVLLALIFTIRFADARKWRDAVAVGLCLGFGVLTKGPVVYIMALFPFVLAPFWVKNFTRAGQWYVGLLVAVISSLLPILLWLTPILMKVDKDFALTLVWRQSAGRISGSLDGAHKRPVFFYLLLLPAMLAPWLLLPQSWRLKEAFSKIGGATSSGVRFLLCWIVPVIVTMSLIRGKQPHYLVPILPGVVIFLSLVLTEVRERTLVIVCAAMIGLAVIGQIASIPLFRKYDLEPIVAILRRTPDANIAFVSGYQGELGYLARLQRPVTDRKLAELDQWFRDNPEGIAIIKYRNADDVSSFRKLADMPYRGRRLGAFSVGK